MKFLNDYKSKIMAIIDSIIYASFMIPTVFYISLWIISIDMTGSQEEKILDLSRLCAEMLSDYQARFLGVMGTLSIITSYLADILNKANNDADCDIEKDAHRKMIIKILSTVTLTIQYYLAFYFINCNFFPEIVCKLQYVTTAAIVLYTARSTHVNRELRKTLAANTKKINNNFKER